MESVGYNKASEKAERLRNDSLWDMGKLQRGMVGLGNGLGGAPVRPRRLQRDQEDA